MDDLIDFTTLDFNNFIEKCPSYFVSEDRTSTNLLNEVIRDGILLMYPLDQLNKLYFKDKKLSKLASDRHSIYEYKSNVISLNNCSFFVCIGNALAYNKSIKVTSKKNESDHVFTNININIDDYNTTAKQRNKFEKNENVTMKNLFLRFYEGVFNTDESLSMTKAFDHKETIHFTIFARRASLNIKLGRKKNTVLLSDILVAEATFHIDNSKALFLNWIAVTTSNLNDLAIHDKIYKDEKNMSLRQKFNLGRFLLIIGQLFKSVIAKYWCPIICQVHNITNNGPLMFYLRNFFIIVKEDHQLVHDQFLLRNEFILHDDPQLSWMIVFQPLMCLFKIEIINSKKRSSFAKILIKGYYHFLNHKINNNVHDQSNVFQDLKNILNDDNFINNKKKTIVLNNSLLTNISDDTVTPIHTDEDVTKAILNSNKNITHSIDLQDVGSGPKLTDGSCMFLCISKLIYGTSSYYFSLRQFLYYLFRNIASLDAEHDFYKDESSIAFNLFIELVYRCYEDTKPPTKLLDAIEPVKYRNYMKQICYNFLMEDFWGCFSDILIFTSIFQKRFLIFEATYENSKNRNQL